MTLRRPITNQKTTIIKDIDEKKDSNNTRWTFLVIVELGSSAVILLSLVVMLVVITAELFGIAVLFFLVMIGSIIMFGVSLPKSDKCRKKDKILHDAKWIMRYWVERQKLSPLFYKHYNDQHDDALSFLMYNYEIDLYGRKNKLKAKK